VPDSAEKSKDELLINIILMKIYIFDLPAILKDLMYVIHCPDKIVQFSPCLTTLPQPPLQSTQKVVERQDTLPGQSHAPIIYTPHTAETLRLGRRYLAEPFEPCVNENELPLTCEGSQIEDEDVYEGEVFGF